jgi:hypothetical protein
MWAYNIINARSHIMFEETTVSHKDKKQDDSTYRVQDSTKTSPVKFAHKGA